MIRWLRADAVAAGITAIDLGELRARGIAGAIVDLDNTLVGYRTREPELAAARWIAAAVAAGMRVVILTNNAQPWVLGVANGLGVPCIANARKPLPHGFRRALARLDLPRERVVVIGDQFFTDVVGAKLFGLAVILVPPLAGGDPWNTRPLRWLARALGVER
jgi:hypothetical protein